MNTKETLEFIYKVIKIVNGSINILKDLHEINNQKRKKKLHIRKRANVYQTLTLKDSEKEIPPSDSEDKINITIKGNEDCNISINILPNKE